MENELDNLVPTSSPTVESILAQPQNHPQQDVLASPAQSGTQPRAIGGDVLASLVPRPLPPTTPDDSNNRLKRQYNSMMDRVRDMIHGVRSGSVQGAPAGAMSNGGDFLAEFVSKLRGASNTQTSNAGVVPNASSATKPGLTTASPSSFSITEEPSAFGRGTSFGYDYGGARVELPSNVNAKDANVVRQYADFTNQMIDWMNEEEV